MDDRRKRVAKSLLDAFGGDDSVNKPYDTQPLLDFNNPVVDPEAARRAERSMRKAFGGEDQQVNPDVLKVLKEKTTASPSNLTPEQQEELIRRIQLEYLRKKSEGQQ